MLALVWFSVLPEHHMPHAVVMNHFVMELDLCVRAVDPVADQDAVSEVGFFVEEERDQVAAAGACGIYWQGSVTMRAGDLQQFALNETDAERDPVFQAVNGIQRYHAFTAGIPDFQHDAVKTVENSLFAHKVVAVRTVTPADYNKVSR